MNAPPRDWIFERLKDVSAIRRSTTRTFRHLASRSRRFQSNSASRRIWDASCAAIDAALAAKRLQLETPDAIRASVIETAVTK